MLKYYLDKTGKVIKSILFPSSEFVDTEPREGSMNPVTSGGVAGSVSQQSDNIAESFSASSTYAIGEVVIGPDGKLYQCTTAVETAGEWDPEDWTETSMVDLIEQDMKDMEEMFLLNLPCAAKTLRFEFSKMDYDPTVAGVGSSGTWKKLNAMFRNVWDWTYNNANWTSAFNNAFRDTNNYVKVISSNLDGVTNITQLFSLCSMLISAKLLNTSSLVTIGSVFSYCDKLEEVNDFDATNATYSKYMFLNCSSLKKVPSIIVSKISDCSSMFATCTKVESGALALYNALAGQTTPPSAHSTTFSQCGKDTETGAAELAQIPSDWGGTAPATLNMGAPQNLTEPLSPSVIEGDDSLTK